MLKLHCYFRIINQITLSNKEIQNNHTSTFNSISRAFLTNLPLVRVLADKTGASKGSACAFGCVILCD